jgi:hypothetical protein
LYRRHHYHPEDAVALDEAVQAATVSVPKELMEACMSRFETEYMEA